MKRKRNLLIVIASLSLAVFMITGLAQGSVFVRVVKAASEALEIPWWTVDSGGGTSTSPAYTLMGTIGQPDASPASAVMSGGSFLLTGGYWISDIISEPGVVTENQIFLPVVIH